ncbi:MAG: SHOCT domain-containing protein [Clostridia bacterium]|nr:SHOCT domain-containing protein [Clostridia bacterium]
MKANKPTTAAAEPAASSAAAVDYAALLEQLAKLHDQNILTDEEFQQKKAEILAKM